MSKTLGGTLFVHRGVSQDYCLKEAVDSLKELCDEVIVVDAGSTDQTGELVKSFEDKKTKVICLPNSEWISYKGREKLAYFTNLAISSLSTDWNFNLQADEVIHENSFESIRKAINEPDAEGYFVRRINLWGDTQHQLNVPHDRIPVGIEIVRLAKSQYQSVVDAQSIHVPNVRWDYLEDIRIYHMGFVRNKFVHTEKIRHMLVDVFEMGGNDAKVEAMNGVFDPWVHFSKEDVIPIKEPLPKFIQEWAATRDAINNFKI